MGRTLTGAPVEAGHAWVILRRSASAPDRWFPLEHTVRRTRRESIEAVDPDWYRIVRRRREVRAVRVELRPMLGGLPA